MSIQFGLVLVTLGVVHFWLINPMTKLLVSLGFVGMPSIYRPSDKCLLEAERKRFECLGFPSGHVEIATIICGLLYMHIENVIGMIAAVVIVGLVAFQRVVSKKHTLVQVGFGLFFGVLYTALYVALRTPWLMVFMSLVIGVGFAVIATIIIDRKLKHEDVPAWVDKHLYPIIEKKQNIAFHEKVAHVMSMGALQHYVLSSSWPDLEKDMDKLLERVPDSRRFEAVVGIKSGGAFLSTYAAMKMGVPNHWVKMTAGECNKSVAKANFVHATKHVVKNRDYKLCEAIEADLRGKRILLLDENLDTGGTMRACKDYLLNEKGALEVVTAALCSLKQSDVVDVFLYDTNTVIWPWGYDN